MWSREDPMRVDLIGADDPAWDERLNDVPGDVYHTAEYHRFSRDSGEGEPFLAVVTDRGRGVAWPYLLRRVADLDGLAGSDATDVGSVYGYTGPLLWGSTRGDPFLSSAWAEVVALWRQQRAVSAFTRFHPLLGNEFVAERSAARLDMGEHEVKADPRPIRSEVYGRGRGVVVPTGLTVSVDCTLDDVVARDLYARALRQHINAARSAGLATEYDDDWAALPTFTRIYRETMVRNAAASSYFFDETYFRRLRAALDGHIHLLVTRMGDAVAAAGLFTDYNQIAQAHLIATDYGLGAPSPSKVLLDDARVWARQRGNTVLHLGGGRGGRHDSLFRFKREFSPRRHLFSTGRWILDPTLYADLAEAYRSALSSRGPTDQSFFPAYRAPLVEPVPSGSPPEPVRSHQQRPSPGDAWLRAAWDGGNAVSENVLFTAAGRRTSLVRAFLDEVRMRGGRTFAGDVDPLAPALFLADEAVRLLSTEHPDYVADVIGIVGRLRIGLIVPTIDPDLPILARQRVALRSIGCTVAVSDESFVGIASDKWATVAAFRAQGIAVPASWLPDDRRTGLPERVFVKPRRGSASRDTHDVARRHLSSILPQVDDPIIQEVLGGAEITIDALLDLDGRPIHYVPRRRIRTLAGESIQGVTLDHDRDLEAWIERLLEICESLGAAGPLCLQAFLTERGPVLSEVNARFGGGFPLGLAAGAAHAAWLLDMAHDIHVPSRLGDYEAGLYMTRYHVEIFTRTPKW
jgi:carbamoyl-phosphate synthase large subunit